MDMSSSRSALQSQSPISTQSTHTIGSDAPSSVKQRLLAPADFGAHGGVLQVSGVHPVGAQPVATQDQPVQPHVAVQMQAMQQQITALTHTLAVANQALERLSAAVLPQPAPAPAAPAPAAVTANAIDALRFERRMMQLDLNRAQRANPDGGPEVDSYKDGLGQIHADIQATSQQLLDQIVQPATTGAPPSVAQQKSNLALLRHERNMVELELRLATHSGLDAVVTDGYRDVLGQFATAITDASQAYTSQLTAQSGPADVVGAQPAVPTYIAQAADPVLKAAPQAPQTGIQPPNERNVKLDELKLPAKLNDVEVKWLASDDDSLDPIPGRVQDRRAAGAPADLRLAFGNIADVEYDNAKEELSEVDETSQGAKSFVSDRDENQLTRGKFDLETSEILKQRFTRENDGSDLTSTK